MKKIGIFGGSFNPIHCGHVALGRELVAMHYVDELWYVVSPHNPLKQQQQLLDDDLRLALVRTALEGEAQLHACDVEFRLPRPSYMVDTLAALRTEHPQVEFVLVIGADNWLCFEHWRNHNEILRHHRVVVYPRPGYQLATVDHTRVTLAATSLYDISATEIRHRMQQPDYDGYGLPPNVWAMLNPKS